MRGTQAKRIRKEIYGNSPSNGTARDYHTIDHKVKRLTKEGGFKVFISTQVVALGLRADYQDAKEEYYNDRKN